MQFRTTKLRPPATPRPPRHIYAADQIALTGFNDDGFVISTFAEPHDATLQTKIRSLDHSIRGSWTNIAGGLRVSIELLQHTPRGAYRRIWLKSDGHSNRHTDQIMPMVQEAYASWININTIGFGTSYDRALMQRIAAGTHNGKFFEAQDLLSLTQIFTKGAHRLKRRHHRQEYTVLCLDLSGSMVQPMGGRRKIDVLSEALLTLLAYKQATFA